MSMVDEYNPAPQRPLTSVFTCGIEFEDEPPRERRHVEDRRQGERRDGAAMRGFDTGATRTNDVGRYDPEGFLSPLVLERFSEYMQKHRIQADGKVRDSDNWQKGMPLTTWAKGLWRHFLHFWQRHRGWTVTDPKAAADIEEDLCAMLFNIQGYLHQLVAARRGEKV